MRATYACDDRVTIVGGDKVLHASGRRYAEAVPSEKVVSQIVPTGVRAGRSIGRAIDAVLLSAGHCV